MSFSPVGQRVEEKEGKGEGERERKEREGRWQEEAGEEDEETLSRW